MAEEQDKIIVDVEIKNGDDAEDQLKSIGALTNQLKKSSSELIDMNKELAKSGKTNSDQYKENSAQINANQQAIQKNNAEVKALSASLQNKNKALAQSKITTEQFTGALDKAVPGMGGFIQSIIGATRAGLAFIATPLGAALAGIVAALALLSTYFTRTEEGGDKLARIMAQVSAAFNVYLDTLTKIAEAMFKLITLDFAGAFETAKEAATGFTDELIREVDAAGKLADLLDELEEKELAYGVAASESRNKIRELMLESKNRTLTEQEKIDKLKEAYNIEVSQHAKLKEISDDKLKAAVTQFEMDAQHAESKRKIGESDIDYAKRIITLTNETMDSRKKVQEAIIQANEVDGQSISLKERLTNMIDTQNEKLRANAEKAGDAALAKIEADRAYQQYVDEKKIKDQEEIDKELQDYIDRNTAKQMSDEELLQSTLALQQEEIDKEKKQSDADYNNYKFNEDRKLKLKAAVEDAKLSLAKQGFAAVLGLLDQSSDAFKAASIAQTLWSTYSAAQKAYESQLIPGDPFSFGRAIAAAIFSVAAGLGRVAAITKYAEGGDVVTIGGKPHSQGGTKFYGEDGTVVEMERGEGLFVLKRDAHADFIRQGSALNEKYGGRSWFGQSQRHLALGGEINLSTPGNQAMLQTNIVDMIRAAISSMPAPKVSVVDINDGQSKYTEVLEKAIL